MNQEKLSRAFNQLLNAKTHDEVIQYTAECAFYQDNSGDPPIPMLEDLLAFTRHVDEHQNFVVITNSDRYETLSRDLADEIVERQRHEFRRQHEEMTKLAKLPESAQRELQGDLLGYIRTARQIDPKRNRFRDQVIFDTLPAHIRAELEQRREQERDIERAQSQEYHRLRCLQDPEYREMNWARAEDFRDDGRVVIDPEHMEAYSLHILRTAGEPTAERLQWLHKGWLLARKDNPDLKHPLGRLVSAWLTGQSTKRIDTESDRRYSAAILRHPLGCVRELAFTERETGQVFKTPERVDQVQMELDLGDTPSILPAIMPLQVVTTAKLKPQTRSGAVSHELRIFFEAMMSLMPNEYLAERMFRLGGLIDFLYPNGKFHWTNQMPHIARALEVLHDHATVPWIDDQGSLRKWEPVKIMPLPEKTTRDTPIYLHVSIPPDAQSGHMVIKRIHRLTGMKSAARWNAYHVACFLWDKYGTMKGKLIDTTRPIEQRDAENRLIDSSGKPLVKRNGKPINSPYDPEAVQQLDREPNPEALKRYPILSEEDLILACFPNGYDSNARRVYLRRAKAHWGQLEADGYIVIDKEGRKGWRILPSSEHVNAHRALRKSAQGVY